MTSNNQTGDTTDREISTTRLLNAPRELVFEVWTKQEHLEKWYGPDGFTITTHEINIQPGGDWRFIMHGPDGTDYPNHVHFTKITAPERIEYTHGDDKEPKTISFNTTITFEAVGDKTLLTMCAVFPTREERDRVVREVGAIEGQRQTIGKMAAHVAKMQAERAQGPELVLTREYNVPADLMWRAWTEKEHFTKWWPPKDFKVEVFNYDVSPGSMFHYSMLMPDGVKLWGRLVYHELDKPGKIVFVNSFADEDGNLARAPFFDGKYPLEVYYTVVFEENNGTTKLTLKGKPINATQAELETFEGAFESMQQGFGNSFEQLGIILEKLTNNF